MSTKNRRQARLNAIQVIYSRQCLPAHPQFEELLYQSTKIDTHVASFTSDLLDRTWDNLKTIDKLIQQHLKNWKQNRISPVLNAILRVATSELLYFEETDAKVVFNEAVEITKKMVGDQATKICNGVLHGIWTANQDAKQSKLPLKPE